MVVLNDFGFWKIQKNLYLKNIIGFVINLYIKIYKFLKIVIFNVYYKFDFNQKNWSKGVKI